MLCAHTCVAQMHAAHRCALHAFRHAAPVYSTHPRCAAIRCAHTHAAHACSYTVHVRCSHKYTGCVAYTYHKHTPHTYLCCAHTPHKRYTHALNCTHIYYIYTPAAHMCYTHNATMYILHTHTCCTHILCTHTYTLHAWCINTRVCCAFMHRHCTHIHKYIQIILSTLTNIFTIGQWGLALRFSVPVCPRKGWRVLLGLGSCTSLQPPNPSPAWGSAEDTVSRLPLHPRETDPRADSSQTPRFAPSLAG